MAPESKTTRLELTRQLHRPSVGYPGEFRSVGRFPYGKPTIGSHVGGRQGRAGRHQHLVNPLSWEDANHPRGARMLVSEVMDPEVVTVERRQSLVEVAKLLHEAGASAAVVVDGDRLIGILTERDMLRSVMDGCDPATEQVA